MQFLSNIKFDLRTNWVQISVAFFVVLMTAAVIFVPNNLAYAGWFEDITGWILSPFKSLVNSMMAQSFDNLRVNDTTNLLTASWNNLFGDDSTSAIAEWARHICNNVVKPIAFSLLSLVMIIQFMKITTKASGNDSFPLMREIITFLIVFAVLYCLIQYADQILIGIYDLINSIGIDMKDKKSAMNNFVYIADNDNDFGKILFGFFISLICMLVSMIASAIAMVICYARGLQLYAYMAFSPIPLVCIGIDETRSYGISFLRNFVSVCLAACIMLFIFYCIPMLGNIMLSKAASNDIGQMAVNILVISFLMCYSLIRSGSWAKEILGG